MNELMQLIETYYNGITTQDLFRGDGQRLSGQGQMRRLNNPRYFRALTRFEEAYGEMLAGSRQAHALVRGLIEGQPAAYRVLGEAVSTSDFPYLFGDTIDRVLLAKFQAYVPDWKDYIKTSSVQDFRDVKRFKCSPGRGLLPLVGQGESYKADLPTESYYTFAVQKRGGVRSIFWEALINDDLQALQDVPNDFAFQAAQTEWYVATSLFAANATLYNTTHSVGGVNYSNKGTAALTAEALADAISAMGAYPGDDADATPVMNDPVYIVTGSKKTHLLAEQILNSLIVAYTGATDAGNLATANIISQELRSKMKARFNPFIRMLDPTNYATSWYLFAEPANGYAAEFAYLRGYEAPSLFMRASAQLMLGGGLASAMEGGFDNDAVDYKIRHVMGGSHTNNVGGWRFSYWSDGTV